MQDGNWVRSRHYTAVWEKMSLDPQVPSDETNIRVDFDAQGRVLRIEWVNRALPSFEELYAEFLKSKGWIDNLTTREIFEAGWEAARK
jgi:hypothetical protein